MTVVCNLCGQTAMFINPGVPCLRKFADGTKVCMGIMEKIEKPPIKKHKEKAKKTHVRKTD